MKLTSSCLVCNSEFIYEKQKSSQPDKKTCSKKCSYSLRIKTRLEKHDSIVKICKDCKNEFDDTSKKKLVERCRPCINAGMVATRREQGSYQRTDEQNKKVSKTIKEKYESGWNPNTQEHREKMSNDMKLRWKNGTMKEKSRKTFLENWGEEHWTKSNRGKIFLSDANKGRKFTDAARQNMRQGAARRIRENNNHYEKGIGGRREDLGHYVRSTWEANFARILKYQGRSYKYEPQSFTLSDGKTYTPDFLVDGIYYEVKGYWTSSAKEKFESFRNQYPEIEVQIIEGIQYDELRSQYRDKIHWEGK